MGWLQALILGIIEGLTEFLPVSSTGHMILAAWLMGLSGDEFTKTFEVAIQLGTILSVLVLYFKRFLWNPPLYARLVVAFIPTGLVGIVAYKSIKAYLFNPLVVSIALIVGGVVLILLDRWAAKRQSRFDSVERLSWGGAVAIGLVQCLAMVPGISRSAATIFGGLWQGFDRKQAAEFSFFLAIPTMAAATGKDLLETGTDFSAHEWGLLAFGSVVGFAVALLAIRSFVTIVMRYGFAHFGYYRIGVGLLFLALYFSGVLTELPAS